MDRLLKLLRDNARNRVADIPKAQVEASGETTLYLYDVIVSDDYWGGISAEKFVKELNALDVPTIHLRINSPGGEVFAARAIEAAIRNHPARIVAHVDGYAASAASFVAVACDEVEIAPGGFFMIHKAWTFTAGNADDLLHTAEMLEKLDASLVDTYAKKSGCTPEDIAGWMKAETWFSARESVERGFADRVAEAGQQYDAAALLLSDSIAMAKDLLQEVTDAELQDVLSQAEKAWKAADKLSTEATTYALLQENLKMLSDEIKRVLKELDPDSIGMVKADGRKVPVYNLQGRLLKHVDLQAEDAFHELPDGIYIVGNKKMHIKQK